MKMIRISLIFLLLFSSMHLSADSFGKDVEIEGIWKIETTQKNVAFNIASSIGYNLTLKFDKDGKVYKLDDKTKQAQHANHTWKLLNDSTLNITFNSPNNNFISNFVFHSTYNDYLKIFEKMSNNCYRVAIQNGSNEVSKYGVFMCKI